MAAIDFLNPAPLMWDFEHEPARSRLLERYEIAYTTPAECAHRLRTGEADLGLVPAAAHTSDPNLVVVPGCTIASLDSVRSILLIVPEAVGIEKTHRVACDTSSMTSRAYTQVLFSKLWKQKAEFVPHTPDLERMLKDADAAMLIGDAALLALEHRQEREEQSGQRLIYYDLAHEWRAFSGAPWVSAFWGVRADALDEVGIRKRVLIEDLEQSRDHGMAHVGDLAEEWSPRIGLPAEAIRRYLTDNIYYRLDADCMQGLDLFFRSTAESGALAAAPPLRWLSTPATKDA